MTLALQTLFASLTNGSVFVLIGIGIVMCYRSSRVVNLAHGETYSISGLATAKLVAVGLPLAASAVVGVVGAAVFALLVERLVLRSRLDWNPRRLIIVTLGTGLLVEGVLQVIFGADSYTFPSLLGGPGLKVHGASLSRSGLEVVVLAIVVTAALLAFLRFTVTGKAMTACAENPRVAAGLGINVSRMRQLSFGLAGLVGGLTAVAVVPVTGITYIAGLTLTLNGFVAAAFANMMHPGRVLWGGLGLGIAEGVVGTYWNPLYEVPVVLGGVLVLGVLVLSRGVRFGGAHRA